jgi:peptidoglycan hydrolase-like protein with peptidoglycan-binding domain
MKTRLVPFVLVAFILGVLATPQAHAETSSTDAYTQIKALTAKIAELQKQLSELTKEVRTVLKEGLSEGMTDADVERIQKLLATDTAIYPEGKITGFFGPLTKEALKRFQKRHGVLEDGTLNKETRELLEKYLKDEKGIPKTTIKTGDLRIKDAKGNTFTCVKDEKTGKLTCSSTKKDEVSADKKKQATEALEAAEKAIEKAEDEIAESDEDTDAAEDYLTKATEKLDMADDAFDDAKYEQARALADVASQYAKKALTKLE